MSVASLGDRYKFAVVAKIRGNAHAESILGIGLGVSSKPCMEICIFNVDGVKLSSTLEQILISNFQFVFLCKYGFGTLNYLSYFHLIQLLNCFILFVSCVAQLRIETRDNIWDHNHSRCVDITLMK